MRSKAEVTSVPEAGEDIKSLYTCDIQAVYSTIKEALAARHFTVIVPSLAFSCKLQSKPPDACGRSFGHTIIRAILEEYAAINQTLVDGALLVSAVDDVVSARGLLQDTQLVLAVA